MSAADMESLGIALAVVAMLLAVAALIMSEPPEL